MEGKGGSSRGKQTAAIDCRYTIWYNKFPERVNFFVNSLVVWISKANIGLLYPVYSYCVGRLP